MMNPRSQEHPEGSSTEVGRLCVLASGSRGNCSVLVVPDGGTRRVILFDAGLSPRRTRKLLADRGIDLWEIDAVLLTHLDTDHAHSGWSRPGTLRAPVYLHRRHLGRADRLGLCHHRTQPFEAGFELCNRIRVVPTLLEHDSLGVAVFRVYVESEDANECAVMSYATDVGRPSVKLSRHIAEADLLAIESNYCPVMQRTSDRPAFLKRRIMGGTGHLSNEQCLDLVARAKPKREVVCLHLSQQCNRPELVRSLHDGSAYRLTISDQHEPTGWIPLHHSPRTGDPSVSPELTQRVFWDEKGVSHG